MNTVKTKVLVSAILSIVLCVSLIAGATFALFTSESSVNVAITSGKVDVVAKVDEDSVYTKQLDKEYVAGTDNTYGDSISIANGKIDIPNIVPGDGVKFVIKVENNSTIAVKYQTILACTDSGLLKGLKVTINGQSYSGTYTGAYLVSEWETLAVGSTLGEIEVAIELEDNEYNNQYQGKSVEISYQVKAVQGNAITYKANTAAVVINGDDYTEYTSIAEAAKASTDNSVIKIVKSTDETLCVTNGDNVTYTAEKGVVLSGGVGGSYWNKSVVLDGLTFKGGLGVSLTAQSTVSYTIKDCTFEDVTATAWKQGVISINGNGGAANVIVTGNIIKNVNNLTTGDSRIDTYGQQSNGIHIGAANEATITNNVIEDVDGTGIYVASASKAIITGNTISEWGTGATSGTEGRAIRTANVTNLTITENKMLDTSSAEEYVKISGTAAENADVSKNYWGGHVPTESGIFSTDKSVTIANYYSDSAMSNFVTINS